MVASSFLLFLFVFSSPFCFSLIVLPRAVCGCPMGTRCVLLRRGQPEVRFLAIFFRKLLLLQLCLADSPTTITTTTTVASTTVAADGVPVVAVIGGCFSLLCPLLCWLGRQVSVLEFLLPNQLVSQSSCYRNKWFCQSSFL